MATASVPSHVTVEHKYGLLLGQLRELTAPPAQPREAPPPGEARWTLRVFDGEPPERLDGNAASSGEGADWRLRECYERFVLPHQVREVRPSTLKEYATCLTNWEKFTDNPPVSTIDDQTVVEFTEAMVAYGFREATINKHLRYLKTVLRRLVPQGVSPSGQTHGRHVLEWLPRFRLLLEDEPEPRLIERRELSAIYRGCRAATLSHTEYAPAPLVWRTLFVLLYTFGLRTRDAIFLTWNQVTWKPECPRPRLRKVENLHGWISFTPTKTRRYKPSPLVLPMTYWLRAHLDELRFFNTGKRVFPIGQRITTLQKERERIQKAAGIPEPYYLFQNFRQTCATAWNDLRDGLGEHVLGHAKRGVHARHYDTAVKRLVRYAPRLAVPEAFKSIEKDRVTRPSTPPPSTN